MSILLNLIGAPEQIADDYLNLDDDTPAPQSGAPKLIVSLRRWEEAQAELSAMGSAVAVSIPNTASLLDICDTLLTRPLLVLSFPAFSDGRAFSQAQMLRSKHRYKGILRAEGPLLPDQISALVRCGFDQLLATKAFVGMTSPETTASSNDRYQPDVQQAFDLRMKRRLAT